MNAQEVLRELIGDLQARHFAAQKLYESYTANGDSQHTRRLYTKAATYRHAVELAQGALGRVTEP